MEKYFMDSDYTDIELLKIARECRKSLVNDTLMSNSPELFDALCCDAKSEIYEVKMELYEIGWLELHWKKICESIDNVSCSFAEKKEMVAEFANGYKALVSQWNYTEFDSCIFDERVDILKALVSADSVWEQELKRMKVSFEQDRKILNKKIKKLEAEE